jgi:hypothetical protein
MKVLMYGRWDRPCDRYVCQLTCVSPLNLYVYVKTICWWDRMWKPCKPNVSPRLTGVHHPTTSCLSVYTVHVSPPISLSHREFLYVLFRPVRQDEINHEINHVSPSIQFTPVNVYVKTSGWWDRMWKPAETSVNWPNKSCFTGRKQWFCIHELPK